MYGCVGEKNGARTATGKPMMGLYDRNVGCLEKMVLQKSSNSYLNNY